jgi:hypothetical protein
VLEARLEHGSVQGLISGEDVKLHLRLRRDEWRMELLGPLHLHRGPPIYDFEFSPIVEVFRNDVRVTKFQVHARIQTDLKSVDAAEVRLEDREVSVPLIGLLVRAPQVLARYEKGLIDAQWSFQGLSYQRDEHRQLELGTWSGKLTGALSGAWTLRTQLGSFEALWSSRYVSVERDSRIPVEIVLTDQGAQLSAQVGTRALGQVRLNRKEDQVQIQLERVPLSVLGDLLTQGIGSDALGGTRAHSGTVTATFYQRGEKKSAHGTIELQHVSSLQKKWALHQVPIDFDLQEDLSAQIRFGGGRARIRKLEVGVPSFTLSLTPKPTGGFKVRAPEMRIAFPMTSMRLGAGEGSISPSGKWQWETELDLDPAPLRAWAQALCLPLERIPPGPISAQFSSVDLSTDEIHAQGEVSLEIFDGRFELLDPAIFDYATQVPETQFDLQWKGIRLDRLGDWLGFGEMDGFLEGYSRETTLQALLPTQFDFRVEVRPHRKRQVVFSPEAMKNTVRLFAGEDLDSSLPRFVDWFAFGWPSRVFGGYNVNYAGISLYGVDGAILVSPLKTGEPFLLDGPRFKIPLRSHRTPIVVDAYAMSNFARRIHEQIENLSNSRENRSSQNRKDPDHAPDSCFVDFPLRSARSTHGHARSVRDRERQFSGKRGAESDR